MAALVFALGRIPSAGFPGRFSRILREFSCAYRDGVAIVLCRYDLQTRSGRLCAVRLNARGDFGANELGHCFGNPTAQDDHFRAEEIHKI